MIVEVVINPSFESIKILQADCLRQVANRPSVPCGRRKGYTARVDEGDLVTVFKQEYTIRLARLRVSLFLKCCGLSPRQPDGFSGNDI